MRTLLLTISLSCLVFLGAGCASITKGTRDVLQVEVTDCGEALQCVATNKKGTWNFNAPGSVRFQKSDDDLRIECSNDDNMVTRSVTPTRGGMIWGNALFGGVIGAGVDANTDAHWEMVDSILIQCEN